MVFFFLFFLYFSGLQTYKINIKAVWTNTYELLDLIPPKNCDNFYGEVAKRGMMRCSETGEDLLYMTIIPNGDLNMSFHNINDRNFTCDDGMTYPSDVITDIHDAIVKKDYLWMNASISTMCALKNSQPKLELYIF